MEEIDVETEETNESREEAALDTDLLEISPNKGTSTSEKSKLTRLPLARVKTIMKTDPDCQLIRRDALILVAKATELFLETLAKETFKHTLQMKRKTILKKDFDTAVNTVPQLCFLDGTLDHL